MCFLSDTLSINYKTKMRSGPRKGGFKFQFSHAQSDIDLCLSPAHLTYSTYLEDCRVTASCPPCLNYLAWDMSVTGNIKYGTNNGEKNPEEKDISLQKTDLTSFTMYNFMVLTTCHMNYVA